MKQTTQADKLVVVRARQKKLENGNNLFFLFTASQVEEVIHEILVQPLPFAPTFLQGIVLWRGHVIPVVDIEKRFGFSSSTETSRDHFLVVRTGARDHSVREHIIRCVLRVPGQIQTMDIPDSNSIINSDRLGVESSMIRGAYQQDEDIFIVPDLVSILQNQQSIDIF